MQPLPDGLLDDVEYNSTVRSREDILRAPFPYPGGKSRSIEKIIDLLPFTKKYVSVFGGSGCDILARPRAEFEVFNDRYAGVVAFYRCLREPKKLEALMERLDLTVHSREDLVWSRDTWEFQESDIEREARWYYMMNYSFASLGRNFGRSTSGNSAFAGKLRKKLKRFPLIHQRFRYVQIENQDWEQCMQDYDSTETVFYCDPPFIEADSGIYKHKMTKDDHKRFIETVFAMKGFVAVSGYSNPIYETLPWDGRHEFDVYVSIKSQAYTEENHKLKTHGLDDDFWIELQ